MAGDFYLCFNSKLDAASGNPSLKKVMKGLSKEGQQITNLENQLK